MKLHERIYLIGSGSQGFNMTDDYDCNVYLIDGKQELAVIDSGAGMGIPQILENIKDDGFEVGDIRHLCLTHAHGDHAGGAARLREAFGSASVYLHSDAAPFLRDGDEEAISLAEAKRVGLYPRDYRFEACEVDVELVGGETIAVGDLRLEAIDTPGHSKGHISYQMQYGNENILFGGDLVFFGGKIILQNIWDCDLHAHLSSLTQFRNAEVDVLLPGHQTFSLKHGQRHIDAALKSIDGLLVPPNLTYGW